jgi:endoglucanase
MLRSKGLLLLWMVCGPAIGGWAQSPCPDMRSSGSPIAEDIRLNQVGFFPDGSKTAVLVTNPACGDPGGAARTVFVLSKELKDTVFKGELGLAMMDPISHQKTRLIDFSALKDTGNFVLWIPGIGYSNSFHIGNDVFYPLARTVAKAYYYQRASMPISASYAGPWARPEGHPDDHVLVHGSAASANRPEGTVISCPGGWYDAGDYNKYIVNSGITMGTLLSVCEDFPQLVNHFSTGIPDTDPGVPDLLEEILYNLRWMLTMQDSADGGVYHKLTNAQFDPFIMPDKATTPRYVVAKGTCATLDFAAVMAQASRVLARYPQTCPGLKDSCIHAAVKAWAWAKAHPQVYYDQTAISQHFSPAIGTGTYGDRQTADEFVWAGIELYISTDSPEYRRIIDTLHVGAVAVPSWSDVRTLGYYSLLRVTASVMGIKGPGETIPTSLFASIKKGMLAQADRWVAGAGETGYHTAMGQNSRDFVWGSNSVAANQGILLLEAYMLTQDRKYYWLALDNLDYILGRNATGYCYVTGVGSHPPLHPHHRISAADSVVNPVPGWMVGGPNPGRQDGIVYPTTIPNEAYTDQTPAYACNEIAINWNAPLVYLVWGLIALQPAQ